jgi:preprotein translocase subunit SecG
MGVKQTTDVLEKGTWIFAGLIAVLCMLATVFLKGNTTTDIQVGTTPIQQAAPAQNGGSPMQPATGDTIKK